MSVDSNQLKVWWSIVLSLRSLLRFISETTMHPTHGVLEATNYDGEKDFDPAVELDEGLAGLLGTPHWQGPAAEIQETDSTLMDGSDSQRYANASK